MPILDIRDGEIYYEVHGSGFLLMIFAPGGLRSELAFWRHSPSNPSAPAVWMDPMAVLGEKYRVVAMDQRNAGRSRTGIFASDDWHVYAADHLALANHLGLDRFHIMGGCIGATSHRVRQNEAPMQPPMTWNRSSPRWLASVR